MSIEKYKPEFMAGEMSKESIPFTQVCNSPLQHCHNSHALAVWCHLQSRPENWIISPQQLRNHFKFGKDKVYKILSYMISANLLTRTVQMSAKGTYLKTNYTLRNGTDFVEIQEHKECAHPLPDYPHPDNPRPDKPPTTKERNTQKKEKEEIKPLSASDDARAHEGLAFDDFWKIYPRKKNKIRTNSIWKKKKYDQIATLICEDISNRLKNDPDWKDAQYIPHPDTYLRNERWTDDITPRAAKQSPKGNAFSDWLNNSDDSGVLNKKDGVVHDGEFFRI